MKILLGFIAGTLIGYVIANKLLTRNFDTQLDNAFLKGVKTGNGRIVPASPRQVEDNEND